MLDGAWRDRRRALRPPANRPEPSERSTVPGDLGQSWQLLADVGRGRPWVVRRAILRGRALGLCRPAPLRRTWPSIPLPDGGLCSDHPSQQNTFTGG